MSAALPRGVRAGYGLGSVATGAFGTVPGLLLLPYLTDTLGVAAAVAGVLVFVPKAWEKAFPDAEKKKTLCDSYKSKFVEYTKILDAHISEAATMCSACLFC